MSSLKDKIKKHKRFYKFLLFIRYRSTRMEFLARFLYRFPQFHCNFLRKRTTLCGYGTYPRTKKINLKNPVYYDDKLLWLKYNIYNKSDLVAQCYDKYLVREYVKQCGCEYTLNELYGVWDDISKIDPNSLPDEYVIKKTNSYGDHIFKYKDTTVDLPTELKKLAETEKDRVKRFKASGDIFATRNKQLYICEKLLKSDFGFTRPEDYKFYCYNGEPKYLLFMWDRVASSTYKQTFVDLDMNSRMDLMGFDNTPHKVPKPECLDELIDVCRKLAKPFPFVRVDLYIQNGHPVFGELTFTPAGGQDLDFVFNEDRTINYHGLKILGDLIDINYGIGGNKK